MFSLKAQESHKPDQYLLGKKFENKYNSGIGSNGLTSARHDVFEKYLATKYPESFDPEVPANLVYSGTKKILDKIDNSELKNDWDIIVNKTLKNATLNRPEDGYMQTGSKKGLHSEYLGHLLSDMQYLPRAYPDAKW